MPKLDSLDTDASGRLYSLVTDPATGAILERTPLRDEFQPATARRMQEAEEALARWARIENYRVFIEAQGQTYWNTVIAPATGLPANSTAYNAAKAFLVTQRDNAAGAAAAAVNRWRTA